MRFNVRALKPTFGIWSSGNAFSGVMLHHLAVRQTNLGLVDARRKLPSQMHSANYKVWWRMNNGLGLFYMVRVCGEGPFLFQHDNTPVHKARFIQKWFVEIRALTSTPSNTFGMNGKI